MVDDDVDAGAGDEQPPAYIRKPELNEYGVFVKPVGLSRDLFADKAIQNGHFENYAEENPDPVPMQPPVGYVRQPSIFEQVRAMVRSDALRREADREGFDTFDEADDFEMDDLEEPWSRYELDDDLPSVGELRERERLARETPGQGPAQPAGETLDAAAAPDPIPDPSAQRTAS